MKQKKQHYVDNEKFLVAMIEHRENISEGRRQETKSPMVTRLYAGECFLKIADHLSYRPNFINYTYRDDMIVRWYRKLFTCMQ